MNPGGAQAMQGLRRLMCALVAAAAVAGFPAASAQDSTGLSQAEFDQMLAPVALYPDVLLSQVLMASTWPLDVVEAARWSRERPGLEGEAAVEAAADQPWDDSVKALLAFPDLLQRMDEDLEWTRRLGEAFLQDEERVADTVQALRQRAQLAGYPAEETHVRVHREREIIYIEPAVPRVIHVPWYDTRVVYGGWRWPAYPPVYWAPFSWHGINVVHAPRRFYWGIGIHVAPTFYFGAFDWHRRHVVIVDHRRHFGKPPGRWRFRDAPSWRDVRGPRRTVRPHPNPPAFRDRGAFRDRMAFRDRGPRHEGPRRYESPRYQRPGSERPRLQAPRHRPGPGRTTAWRDRGSANRPQRTLPPRLESPDRRRFDGPRSARPGTDHRPRWQTEARPDRQADRPRRMNPRPGVPGRAGDSRWAGSRPANPRRENAERIERGRASVRPAPPSRSGPSRPPRSAAPPSPPRAFSHGRDRGMRGDHARGGRQGGPRRDGQRR